MAFPQFTTVSSNIGYLWSRKSMNLLDQLLLVHHKGPLLGSISSTFLFLFFCPFRNWRSSKVPTMPRNPAETNNRSAAQHQTIDNIKNRWCPSWKLRPWMHHQEHSLDLINSPAHKRTLLPRQLPHAQSIQLQPGQRRFQKRTRLGSLSKLQSRAEDTPCGHRSMSNTTSSSPQSHTVTPVNCSTHTAEGSRPAIESRGSIERGGSNATSPGGQKPTGTKGGK